MIPCTFDLQGLLSASPTTTQWLIGTITVSSDLVRPFLETQPNRMMLDACEPPHSSCSIYIRGTFGRRSGVKPGINSLGSRQITPDFTLVCGTVKLRHREAMQ
jgi:hypothetical protein